MFASNIIEIIDTHTAGHPTRALIGGVPAIFGNTMQEKMAYVEKNLDWLRTSTMAEPRGHSDMSGTIWVSPSNPEAHMGILFIDAAGHMPMCGHSTIGTVTALLETGVVPITGDVCEVNIDTPAGLIRTKATIKDDRVHSVTFCNVPSFHYTSGEVEVPGYGLISYDVAFGGNAYAIADIQQFPGIKLRSGYRSAIEKASLAFGTAVREVVKFQHPEKPFINTITHTMFYTTETDDPKANYRNTVVFLPDSMDRSPCGTGTSARVASLFAQGKLGLNEYFIHESVIGSQFKARIIEAKEIGNYKGGIPEITGSAYIMGFNKLIISPNDPFKHGFRLE